MTRKQVGKERVYLACTSVLLFIAEGSQDRYVKVVADAEPIGGCYLTGLLLMTYTACFLMDPGTSLGMVPLRIGWAFSHQSLIKKILYNWIVWRYFLN